MRLLTDISAALMLLTRLPLPKGLSPATPPGPGSAWAWPVAGGLVGILSAAGGTIALALGLAPGLAAAMVVVVQVMATGGLHEDGLADTADGLWGGGSPVRRLDIMRDSRIGSYGVLALILSVLLRWLALSLLAQAGALLAGVIIASALSRAPMAVVMSALPHARSDGLSRLVGRPSGATAGIGIAVAAATALFLWPASLPALALITPLPALWLARLARQKIGGQTGDILGASQQLTEIAALLTLSALI